MTVGLEVFVHDVIAAIATDAVVDLGRRSRAARPLDRLRRAATPTASLPGMRRSPEVAADAPRRPRSSRERPGPAGGRAVPASDGSDGAEVELEQRIELGAGARLAPQALRLGVALDEVDPLADRPVRRR